MIKKVLRAIKNPETIFVVLLSKMHFLSDKTYIKLRYRLEMGKKIDLNNPKSFNEKLNWLKLNDRKSEYNKMVDKYDVREYIADKIGDEYLIPLLGVWDKFDDINFDELPNQFVLKCTHDSGSVVICRDKATFNIEAAKKKINRKMKKNLFWWGREWVYKDLKPRIIAEKYMEDKASKELRDYKLFCFEGKPEFLYLSEGLENHETAKISYVSFDWKPAPFQRIDYPQFETLPEKPKNLDKMIELAAGLSKGIHFLRVDFYEINGKIYFGELTFFPGSGYTKFEPEEWEKKLGELIKL